MLDTIKAYFYQGLCIVLVILLGIQSYRVVAAQREELKAKNELVISQKNSAANLALGESKNRTIEGNLTNKAADIQKVTNEKTTVIYRDSDALLKRLRIAEVNLATERFLSKANPTGSNEQASTGSNSGEFPSEIGEEDVQEAKRADIIRLGLEQCYKQYDEARDTLAK